MIVVEITIVLRNARETTGKGGVKRRDLTISPRTNLEKAVRTDRSPRKGKDLGLTARAQVLVVKAGDLLAALTEGVDILITGTFSLRLKWM